MENIKGWRDLDLALPRNWNIVKWVLTMLLPAATGKNFWSKTSPYTKTPSQLIRYTTRKGERKTMATVPLAGEGFMLLCAENYYPTWEQLVLDWKGVSFINIGRETR